MKLSRSHNLDRFRSPWLFWAVLGFALLVGLWLRASLARGGAPPERLPD